MKALRVALIGLLVGAGLLLPVQASQAGEDGDPGGGGPPGGPSGQYPSFVDTTRWSGWVEDLWGTRFTQYWTPWNLSGAMRVCDYPGGSAVTYGQVMAAFLNDQGSWAYRNTGFRSAYTGGCADYTVNLSRPNQNYWLQHVVVKVGPEPRDATSTYHYTGIW